MGWWSTSSPQPPPTSTESPSSTPNATPNNLSHETQTDDPDLQALLSELSHASSSPSPSSSSSSSPASHPSTTSPTTSPDDDPFPHLRTHHPSTLSCRTLFDSAFHCQSLGGQFNNVYRYGTLRSCSEQWSDFWFCMRTKGLPQGEKEREVRERWRVREEERYGGGGEGARGSEDVWERRRERLVGAFGRDPEELERREGS
ncbi:MAG: hypothetical protein M1820_009735 [Bogoriella megaspora]|nr:MAG: hypothetical protein M1820_009735 [Bogoriella megaspora]